MPPSSTTGPSHPARSVAVLPSGSAGVGGMLAQLAAEVIGRELGLRLPEGMVEVYSVADDEAGPGGVGLVDGPPRPSLTGWDPAEADRMTRRSGAAVVTAAGPVSPLVARIVDDLSAEQIYVEMVYLGQGSPDPLALADRLYPPDGPTRQDFLRMSGAVPARQPYLIAALADPPAGMDVAVDSFAYRAGVGSTGLAEGMPWGDALVGVQGADAVVTDHPGLASLAITLGRPVLFLAGSRHLELRAVVEGAGGSVIGGPDDLRALEGRIPPGPDPAWLEDRAGAADRHLDQLAGRLRSEAAGPASLTDADRVTELRRQVDRLQAANRALRQRLLQERAGLLAHIRAVPTSPVVLSEPDPPTDWKRAAMEARDEADALRAELDRLYSTKTMRAVDPARRLYSRVRDRRL